MYLFEHLTGSTPLRLPLNLGSACVSQRICLSSLSVSVPVRLLISIFPFTPCNSDTMSHSPHAKVVRKTYTPLQRPITSMLPFSPHRIRPPFGLDTDPHPGAHACTHPRVVPIVTLPRVHDRYNHYGIVPYALDQSPDKSPSGKRPSTSSQC